MQFNTTDQNEHVFAVYIIQFTVVIPRTRTNMFVQYMFCNHKMYKGTTTRRAAFSFNSPSRQLQHVAQGGREAADNLTNSMPLSIGRQGLVSVPRLQRSARRPCFRPHCETASVILQFVTNETKKPLFSSSPSHLLQPRAKQSLCCRTNVAKPDEVRNAFVQRWLSHELCILLSMSWQYRSSSCVTIRCCSCHAFGVDHSKPRIHLEGLMPETQIAPNATATNQARDPAILVLLALN